MKRLAVYNKSASIYLNKCKMAGEETLDKIDFNDVTKSLYKRPQNCIGKH